MSHDEFIAGIQWDVVATGSVDPAVSIPLTFDDYAAGRDPVMAEVPSPLSTTAP